MDRSLTNDPSEIDLRVRVFSCCPVCKNKDLTPIDDVSLCTKCSWDSIALSVWAGDYDHVFDQEFTDQGNPTPKRMAAKIKTDINTKTKAAS